MEKNASIYVAGHRGMVGSAIVRLLAKDGYTNIITRTSAELDLRNQQAVNDFFESAKPRYVFLCAAKVGGILANDTYRGEFIYDNLMIEANVIHAAYLHKAQKLLFLGSSCIYPKMAPQPLREEYILSGYLESTNQPYAIAKIAGIEICNAYRSQYGCNFISVMPANLYGPNDNYGSEVAHVIPALLRRFIEATEAKDEMVVVWGSGMPKREFLHVDDAASACLFLMSFYNNGGLINVGSGSDISIADLAQLIAGVVGYRGNIVFDREKPDGTPRKLMDVTRINDMGWKASIGLKEGLTGVFNHLKLNHPW